MPECFDALAPIALRVLTNIAMRGDYGLMRLTTPDFARALSPGQSLQLHIAESDAHIDAPLFRCDPRGEWCEVLYRHCNELSQLKANESIACRGVTGTELISTFSAPTSLLLGSGLGLAPVVFFADQLRQRRQQRRSIALLEFEHETPFVAKPSQILVPTVPNGVIACMPLLEDWGIASRLASKTDQPGTFDGDLISLTDSVLARMASAEGNHVALIAAGAHDFIEKVLTLREKFQIRQELSQICPFEKANASQ